MVLISESSGAGIFEIFGLIVCSFILCVIFKDLYQEFRSRKRK